MLAAGPILCAVIAAFQVTAGTLGDIHAGTRVRGPDQALEAVSGLEDEASPGTHRGIGYTYGETASDRANQYNGRVFDPGTGFHDYGARMYWPQIGRFISPDSNRGSPADPRSLNRYSYVLNNPYKYVDPSGREAALQQFVQQAANQPMGPQLTVIAGGAAAGAGTWGVGTMLAWTGGAGLAGAGGWLAGTWLNDNWLGPYVQNAMDAVFGVPGANTTAGGETPATKAGRAAHANYPAALGDDYEYEVVLPSGKRADAVHKTEPIVRELKPANARAEKRGQTQVDNYAKELQSMDPQQRKWEGVVDTYTSPTK